LCRKPLAETLHGFEEARCELEDELGEFEADRGSFEAPLREGPAGRIPRAERLRSHRNDASLPREVLSTFSSRLSSNSQAAGSVLYRGHFDEGVASVQDRAYPFSRGDPRSARTARGLHSRVLHYGEITASRQSSRDGSAQSAPHETNRKSFRKPSIHDAR
jgi:hypothetical protein